MKSVITAKDIANGFKTSQLGLSPDWIRATFIIRKDQLAKIKALAYWERRKIKNIVAEAFEQYLEGKDVKDYVEEE